MTIVLALNSDNPPHAPVVHRAVCCPLFVFDLAFSIDLVHAERLLAADAQRESMRLKRRSPSYFQYRPAPLRLEVPGSPIEVAGFIAEPRVELLVFDFGACLANYRIPFSGELARLVELASGLTDHPGLLGDARAHAESFLDKIAPAARRPGLTPQVEDYVIYQIEQVEHGGQPCPPSRLLELAPSELARVLRGEPGPMSADQVIEALGSRLSYGPDDAAIIDWNSSILLDRDAGDVAPVLEFANVELLEMRVLDDRLDESLDEAYLASQDRPSGLGRVFPTGSRPTKRIAQLQVDSALLFEGVNNALKLIGDQYLARVYRLAGRRFHLPERDAGIERKLSTLQSIYSKMNDHDSARRTETLEWIIIILIAVEIVMSLIDRL